MNEETKKLSQLIEAGVDSLDIVITLDEVLAQDISAPAAILSELFDNEGFASYFMEKVNISFSGFYSLDKKMWEIPDIRNYICKLDDEFPYWFFFLSKEGEGLYVIFKCRMLPCLSDEDEFDLNIPQLRDNFINRWVPAMDEVCEYVGMSDDENHEMCMRTYSYLINCGIS